MSLGVLDILSFSGYKFIGTVINVCVGLIGGQQAFYISFIINSILFSIFLGKTLRAAIQNPSPETTKSPKNYVMLIWALFQFILIYFLVTNLLDLLLMFLWD